MKGVTALRAFDEIWEQIHSEQEWGKYPSEEVIRFAARNFYHMKRSAVKMLDAGCGTGAVTWFLAREGFNVSGFDGSVTAVRKAMDRLKAEGLSAELRVGYATEMPFENEFFDGIIDSAMIYANTSEAIGIILSECYRILKQGGKLFSTGLFKRGMTGYGTGEKLEEHTYRELTEGPLAHRGTAHFFDRDQIVLLWTKAGFKDIRVDSVSRTDRDGAVKIDYYIVESVKHLG